MESLANPIEGRINLIKSGTFNYKNVDVSDEASKFGNLHFWSLIGFSIVYSVVILVVILVVGIIEKQLGIVGNVLNLVFSVIITPVLNLGPAYFTHKAKNNEPVTFNTFFDGFKDLGKIVPVYLVYLFVCLLAFSPALICLNYNDLSLFASTKMFTLMMESFLLSLIGAVLYIPIKLIYMFSINFRVFSNLDLETSFRYSIVIVRAKFFQLLAFLLLMVLFIFLGALFCGIGLYYAFPFVGVATYLLYRNILGKECFTNAANEEIENYLRES